MADKHKTKEDDMSAELALVYVIADMLETQVTITEEAAKRCGWEIRQELKRALNKMMKGAKDFREMQRREPRSTQLMIGVCADALLQFDKMVLDRSDKDEDIYRYYNLVKNSRKSVRNWDIAKGERDAFEMLIENEIDKAQRLDDECNK